MYEICCKQLPFPLHARKKQRMEIASPKPDGTPCEFSGRVQEYDKLSE